MFHAISDKGVNLKAVNTFSFKNESRLPGSHIFPPLMTLTVSREDVNQQSGARQGRRRTKGSEKHNKGKRKRKRTV